MFQLVGQMRQLPFGPDDIVKVHRGMNMVKVSVGEHISEPSEVYITTVQEGNHLATNVVFFLIEPEVRALYGFEGNPYEPSKRIDVETEAREFVEEMGAILEDIGWENMSRDDREGWIAQQFLFPKHDELQSEGTAVNGLESPEPEMEEERGKGEQHQEAGVEGEAGGSVEEDVILLDTDAEGPDGMLPDEESPEEVPGAPLGVTDDSPPEKVAGDISPDETGEAADDPRVKREAGESLDKADGKIVFVEEKFDEMLKQAFLIPPDDKQSDAKSREVEPNGAGEAGAASTGSEGDPVEDSGREKATVGEGLGESAQEDSDSRGEGGGESPERSEAEIILRFLSKM